MAEVKWFRTFIEVLGTSMGCLWNLEELEEVEVEDCSVTNKTLNKLKQGHIDLLKARKLWHRLCEAKNKVINGKGLNKTPKPKRAKRCT